MSEPTVTIELSPDRESRTKALRSLANCGYLSVWEGAIRSGKSVLAVVAFAIYITQSPETTFLMTGRTLATIERNAILGDFGLLNIMGLPEESYGKHGQSRSIRFTVSGANGVRIRKTVLVMGSDTIKSYKALRGATIGGWFADEITMHERQFVEEAINRSAMSSDRKMFWTLNPDNPNHWIYKDYLDRYGAMTKAEKKELGGYHWWHFTPKDNPRMTPEKLRSLELQFEKGSYLYRRYILGERCIAEGLVYSGITDRFFREFSADDLRNTDVRYCAIDFGANHPTVMVFGGIFGGNKKDWRLVSEAYDEKSGKTTYDYYKVFLAECERLGANPQRITVAVDPAALILRNEFVSHGLQVVRAKNDVLPGIEYVRKVVTEGFLTFSSEMKHTLSEFGSYSWDEKASSRGEDKVVKLGDDCMDAVRYFAFTFMQPIIR